MTRTGPRPRCAPTSPRLRIPRPTPSEECANPWKTVDFPAIPGVSSVTVPLDLSIPRIVATVTRPEDLAHLDGGGDAPCDVLEFRLDNLLTVEEATMAALARSPRPVLLTMRRADEGGAGDHCDGARRTLYERHLDHAPSSIPRSPRSSTGFCGFSGHRPCRRENAHRLLPRFLRISRTRLIADRITRAYSLGADIAKIAVVVHSMKELFELVELVEYHRGKGRHLSAMGMAPSEKLSRLVLAKAGSCLNYGYLPPDSERARTVVVGPLEGLLEEV